jgi:hypothetical protein
MNGGMPVPDGGKHPVGAGPNANLASRPLKAGMTFTLQVRKPLLHKLAFDKVDYSPGDTCELSLAGRNLGKAPLEMIVEAEQDGVWMEVEKVQAAVDSGQLNASISWKFPVPPGHAEAVAARHEATRGNILSATWAQPDVAEGGTHVAQIEAERLDGQKVVVLVEQQFPDGTWRCVSHAEAAVQGGKCEVPWAPPPSNEPPPRGSLVGCAFEDGTELGGASTAWLKVDCAGLENETVQLILEREEESGWSQVSSAVSTVKANSARAGIPL